MCDVSDELLYNGVLPLLTRHSFQLVIVKVCAIVPRAGEMLNTPPPHPASSSIWRMFLLFSCTCFLAHQTLLVHVSLVFLHMFFGTTRFYVFFCSTKEHVNVL